MNDEKKYGLGILDVLQIIFIVLKLTNLINWSWPVVLIPLWIGLAMTVFVIICLLLCK